MVKTILVPTDFRVASLNTLKLALENNKEFKVNVILLYSEFLTDSITDLLFYSPHKIIQARTTPEFKEALEVLKNRFEGTLYEINIKLLHSNQIDFLRSFLKGNNIDEIYIPKTYVLQTPNYSFDPVPILKKINASVSEAEWTDTYYQTEQQQLAALFN